MHLWAYYHKDYSAKQNLVSDTLDEKISYLYSCIHHYQLCQKHVKKRLKRNIKNSNCFCFQSNRFLNVLNCQEYCFLILKYIK